MDDAADRFYDGEDVEDEALCPCGDAPPMEDGPYADLCTVCAAAMVAADRADDMLAFRKENPYRDSTLDIDTW